LRCSISAVTAPPSRAAETHGSVRRARKLREVIAESVPRYEPEIEPSRHFDVESIAVLLDNPAGGPQLAVRIHDLPRRADRATIDGWIELLSKTAEAASLRLARA
jgi:DNA-binding IclR family transcriptional regulator